MEQTLEQKNYIMSDEELDKVIDKLKKNFEKAKEGIIENATLLAQLTRPHLAKVKKSLRGIISGQNIDRLVLFGQGRVAWHLTNPANKTLPASTLRRLPEKALDVLNKPDAAIEILTNTGVKIKPVIECNSIELQQVVDPYKGILTPDMQHKRLLQGRCPTVSNKLPVDEFECLKVENGMVIIYGKPKDKTGSMTSAISVPIKELRRLIK